ncbi:hypothetical protein ACFLS9_06230, partial [Bacteroidota bacterium]
LWLLFISVQLVDILAFLFVLLDIEQIKYNPSTNPFLRTIIEYVPYSHALFANVILALIVFIVFWKIKDKKWGIVLFVGVLSHWFLDVLVHFSDMPLFHNSFKVGLGLWQLPLIAFLFELFIFILAGYFLLKGSNKIIRHLFLIILLSIGFSAMFFAPESEATPAMASIVSLTLYAVFTALAYWCERKKIKSN